MHRGQLGISFGTVGMCFLFGVGTAQAGSITAQGAVTALTDIAQMGMIAGTAAYDEGPTNGGVPLNTYTPVGMTFFTGPLTQILPGVTAGGSASQPIYQSDPQYFPQPVKGGGTQSQNYAFFGGAVKFTDTVTKVGLTAGRNGPQFLTVWNQQGVMLGQVTWTPANDASFIGVDTGGVPIGMVTYGNDDVWAGAAYDIGGSTIMSDTWVWSAFCQDAAACDDADACNGAETCNAGTCAPGVAPVCDDGNVCTDDSCDAVQGCVAADNTAPCDDNDMCTATSVCADGVCGGLEPVDCNDDMVCTEDACDAQLGCSNTPLAGCCMSDAECTAPDTCDLVDNVCIPPEGTSSTGEPGTSTGEPGTSTGEPVTSTSDPTTSDPTTGGPNTGGNSDTDSGGAPTTGGVDPTTGDGGETAGPMLTTFGNDTTGVDPGGCGCRTPARGDGLALLALAALGLRRRRR